jgi:murein DD-endopeptidase MepM/ murein hydrolase activator NlpD
MAPGTIPVMATHDGVATIKNTTSGTGGRMVWITSPNGKFRTVYMHLSKINVTEGQEVKEKDNIAEIGGSRMGGERKAPVHLHYQIEKLNETTGKFEPIDPTEGKGKSEKNIVDPQKWITGETQQNEQDDQDEQDENAESNHIHRTPETQQLLNYMEEEEKKEKLKKIIEYIRNLPSTQSE